MRVPPPTPAPVRSEHSVREIRHRGVTGRLEDDAAMLDELESLLRGHADVRHMCVCALFGRPANAQCWCGRYLNMRSRSHSRPTVQAAVTMTWRRPAAATFRYAAGVGGQGGTNAMST